MKYAEDEKCKCGHENWLHAGSICAGVGEGEDEDFTCDCSGFEPAILEAVK